MTSLPRVLAAFALGLALGGGGAILAQGLAPIRYLQHDGVILDGLRAPIGADGHLGNWEMWFQQDIEGGSEIDTVAEVGYYHVVSCGFRQPEPAAGEVLLPLVVRRR